MHSFLIIGNSEAEIDKKIENLSRKYGKRRFEFAVSKISEVRQLNSFTKLRINEPSTILIKNFDKATVEAQNAFLKNLEEPQSNLVYILTALTIYNLLPTITSRCQIIYAKTLLRTNKDQVRKAKEFIKGSTGEKLLFINSIRGRERAIEFLEDFILASHQLLLKRNHRQIAKIIKGASQALYNLKANANVQLQLTNFVLNHG